MSLELLLVLILVLFLFRVPMAFAILGPCLAYLVTHDYSLKISAAREDDQRQLVRRYEQLAENTLDAQQRMAADLSELRTRIASVEQILRTVE